MVVRRDFTESRPDSFAAQRGPGAAAGRATLANHLGRRIGRVADFTASLLFGSEWAAGGRLEESVLPCSAGANRATGRASGTCSADGAARAKQWSDDQPAAARVHDALPAAVHRSNLDAGSGGGC